jgi:ABC-type dipeptide/oligopeptide/nickel transport system ATPase component
MNRQLTIAERPNDLPNTSPVYENFGVYIDDINENLPRHNGTIWCLCGKGGSGKSSLFLSLFKSKKFLKRKFDEIDYIVRESSFNSVNKNPFEKHKNIHHDLTAELLHQLHRDALERKQMCIENNEPFEHTCIIIDDFGANLKDLEIQHALKEIMNIARHANLYVVFIVQTYIMVPVEIRRIFTHLTLFKCNVEEWDVIRGEYLMTNKNKAEQIYNYVFDEPFNHLDINMKAGELRKNFKLLVITDN